MALRSVDSLIDALAEIQLLGSGQMDQLVMSLRFGFVEPAELAADLVHRRWLTAYQARQIFRGRGRDLLVGPYVLVEPLAASRLNRVYRGRHRRLDRVDAVKVFRPEHQTNPNALLCYMREAHGLGRLSHPNVVTLYDAGRDGDTYYLAMEFVEGLDLSHLVDEVGPLPPAEACGYTYQAAQGLQHAYEQGIVHRDVKPSNLLLNTTHSVVKVLDLGLALLPVELDVLPERQGTAETPAETAPPSGSRSGESGKSRAVLGTPDYMAPEQTVDSHVVDTRADIYSLGGSLYFLLTGHPPFPGGNAQEKVMRHRHETPKPIEQERTDLPAGLPEVVRKAMARLPENRYQTPAEMASALTPFLSMDEASRPTF